MPPNAHVLIATAGIQMFLVFFLSEMSISLTGTLKLVDRDREFAVTEVRTLIGLAT